MLKTAVPVFMLLQVGRIRRFFGLAVLVPSLRADQMVLGSASQDLKRTAPLKQTTENSFKNGERFLCGLLSFLSCHI